MQRMVERGARRPLRQVLFRGYVLLSVVTVIAINIRNISEALQAKIGTLSLEAQSKLEKETAKKEAKAEAKADAALKKKMASQVCFDSIVPYS